MGTQQQILDGGRTILQQVTELAVMRRFEVAANHDAQRGRGQHAAVGQSRRDGGQRFLFPDDHKTPGIPGHRRGRRHGRLQKLGDGRLVDFAGVINPDAPPAEDELEFVVCGRAHNFAFRLEFTPHRQICIAATCRAVR